MAEQTRDVKISITATTAQARSEFEKLGQTQKNVQKSTEDFSKSWTEFRSKLANVKDGFNIATEAGQKLFTALEAGGRLSNLNTGFASLKESTGAFRVSLEGLQKASLGLVSSTELLTQANTAMTLGLPGDELEEVISKVTRLAKAQGKDATFAIESFITGTARQSKLLLDNLGILVSVEKANQDYANQLHKTVEALTDEEKQAAFTKAAMEALADKSSQVAEVQLNAADAAKQLTTTYGELISQFQLGLAENEELSQSLIDLNNGSLELADTFRQLGLDVGDWLSIIIDGVKGVDDFAQSFYDLSQAIADATPGISSIPSYIDNILAVALPGYEAIKQLSSALASLGGKEVDKILDLKQQKEDARQLKTEMRDMFAQISSDLDTSLPKGKLVRESFAGMSKEAQRAADEVKKLKEEFSKLGQGTQIDGIKKGLEEAIDRLDQTSFDGMLLEFETAFRRLKTDELSQKFGKAIEKAKIEEEVNKQTSAAVGEFKEKYEEAGIDANKKISENLQREYEQAFREVSGFWEDVLSGVVNGNLKDTLENMLINAAIKWGAEMLAQATIAAAASAGLGGGGGSGGINYGQLASAGLSYFGYGTYASAGVAGVGPVASGSAYGAALSGGGSAAISGASTGSLGATAAAVAPYAVAAIAAYFGYQGVKESYKRYDAKGYDYSAHDATRYANTWSGDLAGNVIYGVNDWTGWGSDSEVDKYTLTGIGSSLFGIDWSFGGRSKYAQQRIRREAGINRANDLGMTNDGSFDLFGGGTGTLYSSGSKANYNLSGDVDPRFGALGNLLSAATIGDVDEQFAGMWANALNGATSFNAAVLTTQGLLEKAGLTVDDTGNMIVQSFLDGTLSIEDMNAALEGLALIATEDLASVTDAVNLLGETAEGKTRDQIKALELTIHELQQSGVKDAQGLINFFRDKFGTDAEQIIQGFVSAGIDLFGDFANLSYQQLAIIINGIGALSNEVRDGLGSAFDSVGDASARATRTIIEGTEQAIRQQRKYNQEIDQATQARQRLARISTTSRTNDIGISQPLR